MKYITQLSLAAILLLLGTFAQADMISFQLAGNGCSTNGAYGNISDPCFITAVTGEDISEVIGKWDDPESEDPEYVNPNYAAAFSWTDVRFYDAEGQTVSSPIGLKIGSWEYVGSADIIRFYLVKNGNGFTVYYTPTLDGCTNDNAISYACMNSAGNITGGSWSTASALSHLTFFNGEFKPVPEPGTLALLGLGLLGMGAARRRKVA